MHGFGKPLGLFRDFLLLFSWELSKWVVFRTDQDRDCRLQNEPKRNPTPPKNKTPPPPRISKRVVRNIYQNHQKKRNTDLVKSSRLSIPFLYTIQCWFPRKIEHEQNGDCVIWDEWKHWYEFSLTWVVVEANPNKTKKKTREKKNSKRQPPHTPPFLG